MDDFQAGFVRGVNDCASNVFNRAAVERDPAVKAVMLAVARSLADRAREAEAFVPDIPVYAMQEKPE